MAGLKRYWLYGIPAVMTIGGAVLNRIVIAANQGNMPVPWLIDKALLIRHSRLGVLADILPGYTSIGDWLIWTGLMAYLFLLMFHFLRDRITEYEKI